MGKKRLAKKKDTSSGESLERWEGRTVSRQFKITEALISDFAVLSGDLSPIHMDTGFAKDRGLRGRIAHGALQSSLVSCILGMELPGEDGILHELSMKYRKPCYPGDTLTVTVTVSKAYPSVKTIRMKIRIVNQSGDLVSVGEAQSGVSEE